MNLDNAQATVEAVILDAIARTRDIEKLPKAIIEGLQAFPVA